MASQWQQRGEGFINASMDFVGGAGKAFKGLGSRIKRGKYNQFIETFCAVAGDVASRNGRFMPEEIAGLKRFLIENHENEVFSAYNSAELIEKIQDYAIASFLGDEEKTLRALRGIESGSDEAKLVIIGGLAIAFSDGECDQNEAGAIVDYAQRLGVDLNQLAAEYSLKLPALEPKRIPAPDAPPPSPPALETTAQTAQPLCKRCWSFLQAGNTQCDCGRDFSNDYVA
ncbi:tellurite resistance TerB family protein [Thiorhodovibrio frisius]|uniref:Tellurite resistance protein n=1 Tax=Thiorhodovibrio frisius TaxID=631362 RepID=H8Z2G6_9GAMM|nr:TerB family tellurite resistance protein [Thiorhodovibrio frisius]EIC21621.1 tellurite resistance protein [Thiorhodovibrio frisius]WPL21587.1 Tellurite resistance protein [Thiorhodovibrio frisius]